MRKNTRSLPLAVSLRASKPVIRKFRNSGHPIRYSLCFLNSPSVGKLRCHKVLRQQPPQKASVCSQTGRFCFWNLSGDTRAERHGAKAVSISSSSDRKCSVPPRCINLGPRRRRQSRQGMTRVNTIKRSCFRGNDADGRRRLGGIAASCWLPEKCILARAAAV